MRFLSSVLFSSFSLGLSAQERSGSKGDSKASKMSMSKATSIPSSVPTAECRRMNMMMMMRSKGSKTSLSRSLSSASVHAMYDETDSLPQAVYIGDFGDRVSELSIDGDVEPSGINRDIYQLGRVLQDMVVCDDCVVDNPTAVEI